ncbi:hypothetical protein ASD56_15820 [Microbacterium sp. Root166]|uniref:M23 family metallopeptidase n=1 Tax=Microbacterium sp. Root166 TaxID=1736478 RepID=UPI0007005F2E|nr:M23 family metallopeptidase [Microbacterium sp. Root166]KQZ82327.1 hypothetical protein ASD56_15820 [Microbacterium sp. Root166]
MAVTALLAAMIAGAGPASAEHDEAPRSAGTYRVPFANGTAVSVTAGPHEHRVAYDLDGGDDAEVVAAASGWVRALVDDRAAPLRAADGPNENFVWIEHPNGEYTRYSRLAAGTVAATWREGDWIDAGEVIGRQGAGHIHWEVAVPDDRDEPVEWDQRGMIAGDADRVLPRLCDLPGQELSAEEVTAEACDNDAPTAQLAGGPFIVDEGQTMSFDASGSIDPDGRNLAYRWEPAALDLAPVAEPRLTLTDDFAGSVLLTVFDPVEALWDEVSQDIVVRNVPPAVDVVVSPGTEGGVGRLRATVTDPGDDTFAAEVDWGDGSAPEPVTIAQLAAGVEHPYGDDGAYPVMVTVIDDDGGVGAHAVALQIDNRDPAITLDAGAAVTFPGGEYAVVSAGDTLEASASATDEGSDDLTFTWSSGQSQTSYNDAVGADPPLSPQGTQPATGSTALAAEFLDPGADSLGVSVVDDDGGRADAATAVIVVGTAESALGRGRWLREYSAERGSEVSAVQLGGYLEVVRAVSGVFPETASLGGPEHAHTLLSATRSDMPARARGELLAAWLDVASGAVPWDATVTLPSGASVGLLDVLADAERVIARDSAGDDELREVVEDLALVRQTVG